MATRNRSSYRAGDDTNRSQSAPPKKDRRRWCKGKVGREHNYEPDRKDGRSCHVVARWWGKSKISKTFIFCSEIMKCTQCGREEYIPKKQCHLYGDTSKDGLIHPAKWRE